MLYPTKVRLLKHPRVNYRAQWVRGWLHARLGVGDPPGSYDRLPEHVRGLVAGKSFIDVGCMWGVNGKFAFLAEEAGATASTGIDVFGPTPEFEEERRARGSRVEFVLGDATDPEVIARVGTADVVLCAGVLYHHPSPFDLLVALRRMCGERLVLRTSTIPELPGLRNMAIYWPGLDRRRRSLWALKRLGLDRQVGITDGFEPSEGYGNWFWGMTPSCVQALLGTAGFEVLERHTEAFAQTFVCAPVRPALEHVLPGEQAARRLGEDISAAGIARPH